MDFRFLRVANSVILLTIFFLKKEINFRLYGCFRFWGEADVYFFECTVRVCVRLQQRCTNAHGQDHEWKIG